MRPYDLRHAGISLWLYSGVDPADSARRAGQSIERHFRHYAKFLDGVREKANRFIEQSMVEWDRVSWGQSPVPDAREAPDGRKPQVRRLVSCP
ncbi:hypothetical protein ACWGQ4_16130 [Streptomyces sp. NPDC055721]